MPEQLVGQVRRIPGVRVAAPLLEASADATGRTAAVGGARRRGLEPESTRRRARQRTELEPFAGIGAVLLPAPLAHSIGVTKFGREVTLGCTVSSARAPLYEQLHERQIGGLAASPIVVAPLFFAQEMTGLAVTVSPASSSSPPPARKPRSARRSCTWRRGA